MLAIDEQLRSRGHTVLMPIQVPGLDYWEEDGSKRIEAKKSLNLAKTHFDKIDSSDAILVLNYTKKEIENYIGASTFLEMAFAHYRGKKIFVLNPLPNQKYIDDELQSLGSVILGGDLSRID